MEMVLGVNGSPRRGGNSDILLQSVLSGAAEAGTETEEVRLRDYRFRGCIGCERCRKSAECTGLIDDMQLVYPRIREVRGIVLVSPVYSYNVTALMKAFIDRLYPFYHFDSQRPGPWHSRIGEQGRKAVLVAVGEQHSPEEGGMGLTMEVMRRSMVALGFEVVSELPVFGIFERGRVREYPEVLEQAREAGRHLGLQLQDR